MKKVLLVTYWFPPRSAIGAARPGGIAKYLPEFGWEPIIFTPSLPETDNPQYRIIEVPYIDRIARLQQRLNIFKGSEEKSSPKQAERAKNFNIEKLINIVGEFASYPDGKKSWMPIALKKAGAFLKVEKVDALISTSPPVTGHLIAFELKKRYSIPWLADLRDLWTQNPYYPYSPVRKWFEKRLELKTLLQADALSTVSGPLAEDLESIHRNIHIYTIQNGFDPETITPTSVTKKFTITYTGKLYRGKRDPTLLLLAIQDLIYENKIDPNVMSIRFFGEKDLWLEQKIRQYNLTKIAQQYGLVSREESLRRQRESQLLLLLHWNDLRERGIYTGKIYEYLAAKRPILSIGNVQCVTTELLNETLSGYCASNLADLKKILLTYYDEYKKNGEIAFHGNDSIIQKYSHLEMSKKFANVLDKITNN